MEKIRKEEIQRLKNNKQGSAKLSSIIEENGILNIKSKKVMDKVIGEFNLFYREKPQDNKIANDSLYHEFCQICVNQGDRIPYYYFLFFTSDLWWELEDQELIKDIIKIIFANKKFLFNFCISSTIAVDSRNKNLYILYKACLEELSNPSINANISGIRTALSGSIRKEMFNWPYKPFASSQELFNKLLQTHEFGKILVCAFSDEMHYSSPDSPLELELKTLLSYAYSNADIVKFIYEPFIDTLASATIEDAEKVDVAYVKALEKCTAKSPGNDYQNTKTTKKEPSEELQQKHSRSCTSSIENEVLNIKSKNTIDSIISKFREDFWKYYGIPKYCGLPKDCKIPNDSSFHKFCQTCVSQSDRIHYFYFLLSTPDLWWKLEDEELIKNIVRTIFANNSFLAAPYFVFWGHGIASINVISDPYILYKTYSEELSNPSENVDINSLREHLSFKASKDMFFWRGAPNERAKKLLNKLLQNRELGQFLACAGGDEMFDKYSICPIKSQFKKLLSYSYDHVDMVKTLYEPFIDTLASASIEDGKRVDAAFAKYLEECNAKSSSFDSLDIKPKNLKPLDQNTSEPIK